MIINVPAALPVLTLPHKLITACINMVINDVTTDIQIPMRAFVCVVCLNSVCPVCQSLRCFSLQKRSQTAVVCSHTVTCVTHMQCTAQSDTPCNGYSSAQLTNSTGSMHVCVALCLQR